MKPSMRLTVLLPAAIWLGGCASTQTSSSSSSPSLPSPTSSPSPMPSMPSPSSSPASRPSLPSPSSPGSPSRSSSSSSSSSNPGQTGPQTPGATPGATPSQPGGAQASAPSSTGGQNDLEVLDPEPPEDLADADPTWDEGDAGGGAEGGGESGGGASGGAEGGAQPAGANSGGPAGQPGAQGGVRVATPGGVPGGEESLDQELNRSLEIFDDEMQRTITILASARGGGEGEPGGGSLDAEPGDGGDPLDQTGQGSGLILVDGDPSRLPGAAQPGDQSDGEEGTEIARAGNRSGLPGGGTTRNEAYPRIPADVGDGSDDDVVARQIREAALNESDPVLREKLWQEYRNYKKSIK